MAETNLNGKRPLIVSNCHFFRELNVCSIKEVYYLRWNEHHLRAYFDTLMALLKT